jgi:hypothetical protein
MRIVLALLLLSAAPAAAESFHDWPRLMPRFPSTGGGGVIIDEYRPMVEGASCRTDFLAIMPDGAIHRNRVVFDAVPAQGGILCTNGRWRALDGDAEGTTPFRVFFRDGVAYAPPTQ